MRVGQNFDVEIGFVVRQCHRCHFIYATQMTIGHDCPQCLRRRIEEMEEQQKRSRAARRGAAKKRRKTKE